MEAGYCFWYDFSYLVDYPLKYVKMSFPNKKGKTVNLEELSL